MSEAVEVKWKVICDDLHKILSDIHLSLIDRVVQFDEEWALGSVRRDEINQLKEQSERAFAIHKPKIMRDDCRIIVFGETSAGKSTVINSLLKRDDLPNKNGRTTNCFVEIRLKDETFFTYQNQSEKDMSKLKEKTNFADKSCLENGSRVQVFYTKEDCPFLQEGMTIIDIPGIDTDVSIDNSIIEYCSTADIIILVVNSTQCIKGSVNKLINKSTTKSASLNVFFVFNHWDRLDGEIDKEAVKEQLMENAMTFFKDRRNPPTSDMNDRIFFISGKEQMRLNKIKNDSIINEHQRIRNNNFIILEKKLQEEIKLMRHQRKYKYILELCDVIEENIKECETYFLNLKKKAFTLEKSKVILQKFHYSHGEIKGRINSALEDIIAKLLEKEKKHKIVTKTERDITNPFNEAPMLDIILQCLHSELGNNYKYFKRDIIKYFHQDTDMDAKHCILIIEKLYFRENLFSDLSFRKKETCTNDKSPFKDRNSQGENKLINDVTRNPDQNTSSSNQRENNGKNIVTRQLDQNTSTLNQEENNSNSNVTYNLDQNTSSSQGVNNGNNNVAGYSDQNTLPSSQGVKTDQNSLNYDAFVSIFVKNLKSFFGKPELRLSTNFRYYLIQKIELDLTNDYLAFVEDIDKLLEKEFEKNFDNNDPTIKIREIRKDLDDVRRRIKRNNLKIF